MSWFVSMMLAANAFASDSIRVEGNASDCASAEWSAKREYELKNECDRAVRFEVQECLIGCTTRVVTLSGGRSRRLTLMGQGLGIKEPIRASFK